jgi:hypothetical protein
MAFTMQPGFAMEPLLNRESSESTPKAGPTVYPQTKFAPRTRI